MPLTRRPLGDELAEELRRLDSDEIYAEALGAATGLLRPGGPHRSTGACLEGPGHGRTRGGRNHRAQRNEHPRVSRAGVNERHQP